MVDPLDAIEIRALGNADSDKLSTFFAAIVEDAETVQFFHPHPLTRSFAIELCACVHRIKDRYFIATANGDVVGYSMLRGWDEGYLVPSFGACVHPSSRNLGLGKRLLVNAIMQSKRQGAKSLRLTVFKANHRALNLYQRFGFSFSDKNSTELVGLLHI